ncbi:8548_t:CDS:1, partial [Scutellospora calospora]
ANANEILHNRARQKRINLEQEWRSKQHKQIVINKKEDIANNYKKREQYDKKESLQKKKGEEANKKRKTEKSNKHR